MFIVNRESAFGDALMTALFVRNLIANGIDACFNCDWQFVADLVDCPRWDGKTPGQQFTWSYGDMRRDTQKSILRHSLDYFSRECGLPPLAMPLTRVPVHFVPDDTIPAVDIAITSCGGPWSPYRHWPHFKQLKRRLPELGLSFVDLNESQIYGQACLNYVAKSRLYLGLETGTAHLVSSVAPQGLIIQSGYTNLCQWSTYDYHEVAIPLDCKPCYLREGCPFDHRCMTEIGVERVLRRILDLLGTTG